MKHFNCYLCNHAQAEVLAKKTQIRFNCYGHEKWVAQCSKCGLVQLYPSWTDHEMDKLYARYSQKEDFAGKKRKIKISPYLESFIRRDDNILEIGCGYGDNLKRLLSRGYKVKGIDKDPSVCNDRSILLADINDFESSESFDFIYGIHILEHIARPEKLIHWITEHLNEGGRFLLELPNVEDPLLSLYNVKNFRGFYWYPYHLFFFSPKTVRNLFSRVSGIKIKISLSQEYGIINHLRWAIFGRPGNSNFKLPLIDDLYRLLLTRFFRVSDTIIIFGEKERSYV